MKKLFYIGLICLGLFEILNVYFIMPMPGSQKMHSIDIAYFLYSYRWVFRTVFALFILTGSFSVINTKRKWIPAVAVIPVLVIIYLFNFKMTADHMFLQPQGLVFHFRSDNTLTDSSLVIAVTHKMESKAYPIRYIQYHHQVRDSIGGRPIMVTYCNICRTGRVFEPLVDGNPENFRLVGMDHFNAMFEDQTTKSWWRQATGEAITGPLTGTMLPEVESSQYSLGTFFALHPFGKVMIAEARSKNNYDTLGRFEKGRSRGDLTRTDTLSWKDKSWVMGVQAGNQSKAYDWIEVKKMKIINDFIGKTPIVVAIAPDGQSFVALERNINEIFTMRNDSLVNSASKFDFEGRSTTGAQAKKLKAYQEFWHSWKQFHPATERYDGEDNGN